MMKNKIADIYHNHLLEKKDVLQYLYSRKITADTINKFKIGYCENNMGLDYALANFTIKDIEKSGIFYQHKDLWYDSFNGRITFPLFHEKRVVHMTARAFYPNEVKHLHQKGKIDFAYNHDILYSSDYVFVTEGPTDCLTLVQNGLPAIGLLGVHRLSRQIIQDLQEKNVYIVFDSEDNGTGSTGANKLANKLSNYRVKSTIIDLPKNGNKEDVNSYFRKHTKRDFMNLVNQAKVYDKKPKKQRTTTNFRSKVPIITIAQKYLQLSFAGGRYKAICPFHADKDPSLVFYHDTNTYYCFACGETGDTVKFVKKMEEQRGNIINYSEAKNIIGD